MKLKSQKVAFLRLLGALNMNAKTYTQANIHTYICTHTQTDITSILAAIGLRKLCLMYKQSKLYRQICEIYQYKY